MRSLFFGLMLLCGHVANAATVTLDFDEYENLQDYPNQLSTSKGFVISGATVAPSGFLVGGPIGNAYFQSLTKADGGTFDLISMDVGAGLDSGPDQEWTFTGFFAGGGTVVASGFYPNLAWTTVSFDSAWVNLEQVTISVNIITPSPNGNVLDNIVMANVTAVPIPAAVWLFGSALAGLGWVRRSR